MKKYTRGQIEKAISYWKKQLSQINENKSKLLNVFEKEFGIDQTYSEKLEIEISEKNIVKIYDILNKNFFGNQLSLLPGRLELYCGTNDQISKILVSRYGYKHGCIVSDKLALFQPHLIFLRDRNTGKNKICSLKNGFFINLDYGTKATLAYLISTICHEMIHCLDCLSGHLLEMTAYCIQLGCDSDEISYESHFTPTFKNMSSKMKNENGITIHVTGESKSFEEINKEASKEIQVLKETDDLSQYSNLAYDKIFREKYKDIMFFCDDGSVLLKFS